jgi:cell wall-associated NlpC family hydrolase
MSDIPEIRRFCSFVLCLALLAGLTACGTFTPRNETTATGQELVRQVKQLLGTPYRYGGNDPDGFDCSGLVQFAYSQIGIAIPRTTRAQLVNSQPVAKTAMLPGDLVFFRLRGRKVSHVGMYIGHRLMIHAPSNDKSVSYARLDKGYWGDHIAAVGRYY